MLRYALSASVRNTATVAAELEFVRDYLDLQRLRYGDRLQVHIDGAAGCCTKSTAHRCCCR